MVLGHKECGKGFVYRNGECVLRSSLYSNEFYKSIFGEEPPPDDIPDNKSPQHDSGEEGHGQVIPDSNTHYDPDAGVVVDDEGQTIEPVIEPDDTPSAPPARRQPVKPDASQVIKGVVSQAPTPDYDNITPMNEDKRNKKRKPDKPDKPSGAATHTLDSIVLKAPAPDYDNIKPMDAVAIAGLGGAVVSGTAGGILITGTAESATADVIGTAASNTAMLEEMGVEGIEMTEVGIEAAETTAAAAELAAATGGAAAAETTALLGVSEALATAGVASAGETAGVGLVVLGGAAAVVAGTAEVIDHADEIGNSFNDLGNEISKTFDKIF